MIAPLAELTIIGTGDVIEEKDRVEFRLLYQGELLAASRSDTRAAHKHVVRRQFHPQLRRLWDVQKNLRSLAEHSWQVGLKLNAVNDPHPPTPEERFSGGIEAIAKRWPKEGGFNFVPLVTEEMVLRCSIDILLLRPEEKKYVFEQGDIDGQLKTLFDALRIPKNLAETGGMPPEADELPFFCLLEDDKLISEVHVVADQMLLLPHAKQVKANDAFAVIHVKLNHKNARAFDNYFG